MLRLGIICCLLAAATLAKPAPKTSELSDPTEFEVRDIPLVPLKFVEEDEGAQPLPTKEVSDNGRATHDVTLNVGNYYWVSHSGYGTTNYPNNYDIGLRLRGSDGQAISISCSPFSLEYHSSCDWDYLSINGQKFCGTRTVPTITSTLLTIAFHTDYSVTATGFYCRITVPTADSGSGSGSGSDCQCGVPQSSRVVGGTQASAGQFPWQAGLVPTGSTRTFCGGSVINNRYVLTAAHCTDGKAASQIQVLLGDLRIGIADAGEQRYSVQQKIEHPQYVDAIQGGWDYALLKLDRPITYSSTVSPICLAQAGQTYTGVTGIASGFGRVGASSPQSNWLLYVPLTVWSQAACQGVFGNTIKSTMICAGGSAQGGQGVCMGDSGGPLTAQVSGRYRVIGIASFVSPCANANIPDVFARVTEALSWIQSSTSDAQYCTA